MLVKFTGIEVESKSIIENVIKPLDLDASLIHKALKNKDFNRFKMKRAVELTQADLPSNSEPQHIAHRVAGKNYEILNDKDLLLTIIGEWLMSLNATVTLTITGKT